jgi:beta-galactosidase
VVQKTFPNAVATKKTKKMIERILFLLLVCVVTNKASSQRTLLFDNDWRFFRGNDTAARLVNFNDAKWRKVDLPHDYSIENLPGTNSPFDSTAVGQVHVGFTVGGTGWYRKSFVVPATPGKRVVIQFDGVYMNANFWVNGIPLGNHPYGYTSFAFDITDKINKSGKM